MSKRRGPWEDGHRAWTRLTVWHDGRHGAASHSPGDAALDAMTDVGTLRRLLDQAELAAVRAARRDTKSWAEIATQLGITRQSAWERWRELDEEETPGRAGLVPASPDSPDAGSDEIAAHLVGEVTRARARALRREAKVTVPNVVGRSWDDALRALMRDGLAAAGGDPDEPPHATAGWPNVVVVDQVPEAGAKVPAGSQVKLWLRRGGGSAGVREPRRPSPTPKSGYEWREEPSDEAVG